MLILRRNKNYAQNIHGASFWIRYIDGHFKHYVMSASGWNTFKKYVGQLCIDDVVGSQWDASAAVDDAPMTMSVDSRQL